MCIFILLHFIFSSALIDGDDCLFRNIFRTDAVQGQLFFEIQALVGKQTAIQVQELLKNLKLHHNNGIAAVIGSAIFFFGASGVFSEIQSSIHLIWKIKPTHKNGFRNYLKLKLLSFLMVGSISFLLIVSLVINSVLDIINKRLESFFKGTTVSIVHSINSVFVLIVITIVFMLIFKTLHDKKMKWKYVFVAALNATLLFLTGKYLIGSDPANSIVISVYGAAGTLIMLLVGQIIRLSYCILEQKSQKLMRTAIMNLIWKCPIRSREELY